MWTNQENSRLSWERREPVLEPKAATTTSQPQTRTKTQSAKPCLHASLKSNEGARPTWSWEQAVVSIRSCSLCYWTTSSLLGATWCLCQVDLWRGVLRTVINLYICRVFYCWMFFVFFLVLICLSMLTLIVQGFFMKILSHVVHEINDIRQSMVFVWILSLFLSFTQIPNSPFFNFTAASSLKLAMMLVLFSIKGILTLILSFLSN